MRNANITSQHLLKPFVLRSRDDACRPAVSLRLRGCCCRLVARHNRRPGCCAAAQAGQGSPQSAPRPGQSGADVVHVHPVDRDRRLAVRHLPICARGALRRPTGLCAASGPACRGLRPARLHLRRPVSGRGVRGPVRLCVRGASTAGLTFDDLVCYYGRIDDNGRAICAFDRYVARSLPR